nr:hypothetical protein [uncultured Bacteroides sp.]
MGQIEDLVKRFNEQDILFKEFEIESLVKALQNHIRFCDTLSIEDKIKALSFIYDKCDYILNSIASLMNYQLEYEPNDDEIWDFVEQEKKRIDISSDDLSQYEYLITDDDGYFDESTLYESVIGPMREKYKEKNKDASEWCDKIENIQTNIYIKISEEKEKQVFLSEVFKSDHRTVITTIDECLVNCNKATLKSKLSCLLRGKKGNDVAIVIKALEKAGYIITDTKTLHKIFKDEFGVIGEYNAIRNGIRLIEGYEKTNNEKGKHLFEKMEIVIKELKQ